MENNLIIEEAGNVEICSADSNQKPQKAKIGFFEKYLTVWVLLCMITGGLIGLEIKLF